MSQEILDKLKEIKTLLVDPSMLSNYQTGANPTTGKSIQLSAIEIFNQIEVKYPKEDELKGNDLKVAFDLSIKFGIELGLVHMSAIS